MEKKSLLPLLDNIALGIIITILFFFPLLFFPAVSDTFILPKQILIIFSTILLLIVWTTKLILKGRIGFLSNPLNLPLFLFGVAIFCSSVLSHNKFDSFMQSIPVMVLLIFSFLLINLLEKKESFNTALSSLALGAVASSIISILYFLHVFILPFGNPNNPLFTTFGNPIQHFAYLLPIFFLSGTYVYQKIKSRNFEKITSDVANVIHFASAFILLVGLSLNIYKIFFAQDRPIVLPVQYGIQIAASALTQDTQRQLPSLLFGSGFGTFLTDFTRFKPITFNLEPNIWNLNIAFSSSLALELLATTGILGTAAFLYILFRFLKNRTSFMSHPLFLSVLCIAILSLLVPYSFTFIFLIFTFLSLYIVYLYLEHDKNVFDVNLTLVPPQNGLFSLDTHHKKSTSPALPLVLGFLILLPLCVIGYYSLRLLQSDMKFTLSQKTETLQNGQKTYDLLRDAIQMFPYRDDYYRLFSQVNISLANSLTTSVKPGEQPTQEMQKAVFSLLQQSINSARSSVEIAPLTVTNWTNLGKIYRSLVNVGQNAEQFSVASYQQAIKLNPYDPQNYIETGGIFYQLGQFDAAIAQFQNAATLKPDLPNAHYNLGHAYEAKGDFDNAMKEYEIVKTLTQQNEESVALINQEIEALQSNMEKAKKSPTEIEPIPTTQNPLNQEESEPFIKTGSEETLTIPGPPSTDDAKEQTSPTPTPSIEE